MGFDSHVLVVSQQWNVLHYRQWKILTLHLQIIFATLRI